MISSSFSITVHGACYRQCACVPIMIIATYGYGRTTTTATGVRRLRLRACYAYGYGRTSLRLRAYYAYGYGRIAATTMGVLQPQAYYGLATGCKLTSGHYNRER